MPSEPIASESTNLSLSDQRALVWSANQAAEEGLGTMPAMVDHRS